MLSYYTSITIIVWFALFVLCTLVYENSRLSSVEKKIYFLTYGCIFLASLAEWVGVHLSGNKDIPVAFLRFVKCCDYSLTPLAGGVLTGQMRLKNVWSKILHWILLFNVLFQIVSSLTGWTITIDENNVYKHGALYPIYICIYLAIIIIIIIQFLIYGKNYRKQNRNSLILSMSLVMVGIVLQESIGGDVRTAYISLTLGAALMFIHTSEFSQQMADERVLEQHIQIKTDALTGLSSRYAYLKALEDYENKKPENLTAISIDINGLKMLNDTQGHDAGDELLCGAAKCIKDVFGKHGTCYRTGGDEFIILAKIDKETTESCVRKIYDAAEKWKGSTGFGLSLSVGYALSSEHSDMSCTELIKEADKGMYEVKDEYYRKLGTDRRRR